MTLDRNKNKGTDTPLQINGQALEFPVTYRLKAVMLRGSGDAENKKALVNVFNELKIGYLFHTQNRSSSGNYVSYTYEVTLNDRESMQQLYALLKEIDNLKFAL
jgi:putative lipoic acid-binding regulatory protein